MVLRSKLALLWGATIMLLKVLVSCGVALSITYGQPGANKHPNVGALVGTFDGQTYPYCSGTLTSPTLFLSAAHCAEDGSTVYVTFDSTYTSKSKRYTGTFYSDPLRDHSQNYPHDFGLWPERDRYHRWHHDHGRCALQVHHSDGFRFMIGPPQTMILKQELTLFTGVEAQQYPIEFATTPLFFSRVRPRQIVQSSSNLYLTEVPGRGCLWLAAHADLVYDLLY